MAKRQRRQDMAKRRTAAAQERMRIISQLARKEKRDDDFGMRDEDWDVYKVINRVRNILKLLLLKLCHELEYFEKLKRFELEYFYTGRWRLGLRIGARKAPGARRHIATP